MEIKVESSFDVKPWKSCYQLSASAPIQVMTTRARAILNQMHRFLFEEKFKETTKAGKIVNLLKFLKKKIIALLI